MEDYLLNGLCQEDLGYDAPTPGEKIDDCLESAETPTLRKMC